MNECIRIETTADKKDTLQQIANELIKLNLAACIQIGGPVESIYQWKGKIEKSSEWVCLIKSTSGHEAAIAKTIRKLHHYDQPQIVTFSIDGGCESFLEWIANETRVPNGDSL